MNLVYNFDNQPCIKAAWAIHASRLVQTQAALNEAVYIILRIQGSEVFVLRSALPKGKEC